MPGSRRDWRPETSADVKASSRKIDSGRKLLVASWLMEIASRKMVVVTKLLSSIGPFAPEASLSPAGLSNEAIFDIPKRRRQCGPLDMPAHLLPTRYVYEGDITGL